MLDSGRLASRSTNFNLKDYIEFCRDHLSLVQVIVGFDVVGPARPWAHKYSPSEMEQGAQASYANQQAMKAAGLAPIPVYHQGERVHWLEQMLRDGEPYIGVAFARHSTPSDRTRWLEMIFNVVCDKDGRPFVRVHGFGVLSFQNIVSYPWRSVDTLPLSRYFLRTICCTDVRHKRSARVSGPDHFDAFDELAPLDPWTMIQYSDEEDAINRLLSFWRLRDRQFLEGKRGSIL